MRRFRIRFIGNGRLVRNAVGSRYYLTSLSASYLTTKVIVPLSTTYRVLLPKPEWYGQSDSNRHDFRHRFLRPERLPITPWPHMYGPRSAKEPYFFLLTSRADLDKSIYSIQRKALFSYGLFGKTGANRTHASLIWSQSVLPIIRRPQNLRPPIRTLRPCYNVANM